MRAEFRFFQNHDGIDVFNVHALFVQEFLRVLKKFQAVGVFPLGIGVGEMRADIA